MRLIQRGIIATLLLVSAHPVRAAFQEYLWGARPTALAGAFTALADDANAPAYNPAGISLMDRSEVTFMYAQLYSGITFHSGADTSRLGLGYVSFVPMVKQQKYGSFATSWTNLAATNLYREDSFSLTWADAQQFENRASEPVLAYGLNLKYLRRTFNQDTRTDADPVFNGGATSGALTVDVGIMVRPDFALLPGLKFGFAAQNLTEPDLGLASTDRVPARYKLGMAYQDRNYRWFNPSLDLIHRDSKTIVAAGVESWVAKDTLAFRFGGDDTELTGGLGYQFKIHTTAVRLDYAILWPMEVKGSNGSHRVSLTTSF